jgi:2-hydroxycyclohexanecarboxyl-CoA dehydrogenase
MQLSAKRLLSQRVLVTAAGAGIGRAIATRLHAEGATVVACDVDSHAVTSLAEELPGVLSIATDVSDEDSVRLMAERVRQELGGLDGLVNSEYAHTPRAASKRSG